MKKIKWGILGYARIARETIIPAIIRSSNSEIYAVASRTKDKLKECASRYDFKKTYLSYDELLKDENIDAVYVPLPNALHKEWAIKAMENKKHVLCEKPIALTCLECEEMIHSAKKNNVNLMEAFMYRYTDRSKKIKDVLQSGVLGEIKFINSTYRFYLTNMNSIKLKPELGGGSLLDVGCYPLNFIGMITKEFPISFSAEFFSENSIDYLFSAALKYKSGLIATLNCGFNVYKQQKSEIVGTKGILEIPDTFSDIEGFMQLTTDEGIKNISIEKSDRYKLEIEDFADSILENRKPFIDTVESLHNTKILEELRKIILSK
jgi:D-xylose 1-dehydrogenase (NADP+, D-xylono-1,5-lactone-forming)